MAALLFAGCSMERKSTERKAESTQQIIGPSQRQSSGDRTSSEGLSLSNTTWERCQWHATYDNKNFYVLTKVSFSAVTKSGSKEGYKVTEWKDFYASDKSCTKKITAEQAESSDLSSELIEDIEKLQESKVTANTEIGAETSDKGIYELDSEFDGKKTYHLIKITPDSINFSLPCLKVYVAEKICAKVDGDSPKNRAKKFVLFKSDPDYPFKKVTTTTKS
jgi:hypothetical protein